MTWMHSVQILSKFADYIKLRAVANKPHGYGDTQRSLYQLENWSNKNLMKEEVHAALHIVVQLAGK